MERKDFALAFLVVTIWGGNLIVIKLGLNDVPPMLLAALRYIFTALPAIAFIKPPRLEWRYTIAYGMTIGFGQFSCLFYAMYIGMRGLSHHSPDPGLFHYLRRFPLRGKTRARQMIDSRHPNGPFPDRRHQSAGIPPSLSRPSP